MTDKLAARRARHRTVRWRRPPPILGPWARAALSVAIIAVSIFFAVLLAAKIARPYQEAGRQQVQLAETLQQSSALEAQNAELERRIAYLRTPGGVASEARRLGYLHPGEYPIVVEGLNGQASKGPSDAVVPQAENAPSAPAALPVSPMRRFWRHLSGLE